MQYDVNSGVLQVVIEGEEINAVVGEAAQINVGEAINYIQSGTAEIEEAVEEGITQFNENATEKTNEFDLNAQNKTSDFNANATQKTLDFNSNASNKTSEFNLNAQDKTSDFNSNAVEKTNDFNSNAQDKTGDFNRNASNKTTDFNDNYTAKKALIDAQVGVAEGAATTATNQAGLAKQWAIGDPSEPVGNSSKYWAEYAESIAQTIGDPANKDLSNLSTTGNNRFVNLQQQIDAITAASDVTDIVGTYAQLQAYDTSTLPNNSIIKVLQDESRNDETTYYRWVITAGVGAWVLIGEEGPYYTKAESDATFQEKLVSGTNIKTVNGNSLLGSGDLSVSAQVSFANITGQPSDNTNLATAFNAKQDIATAVNYNNISNCITEIPQDIKLELNNGTLTLKAGSKVYVPNGVGVFDEVTIDSDLTHSFSGSASRFAYYDSTNNTLRSALVSSAGSGTTPSGTGLYYNTSTNNVDYLDNGTGRGYKASFPLCISNSDVSSIDQVFNGFGYIGSTVFALPGVKGLIPNGRNDDGSLKNTEFSYTKVSTYTASGTNTLYIRCGANNYLNAFQLSTYYDEVKNRVIFNNLEQNMAICGTFSFVDSKITSLTPKTAFHAVDYNDAALKQNFQVVTALPANPISGVFYFVKES